MKMSKAHTFGLFLMLFLSIISIFTAISIYSTVKRR
nr:MAG TPA: hypothetical protein [Caudoviricetes sp.]